MDTAVNKYLSFIYNFLQQQRDLRGILMNYRKIQLHFPGCIASFRRAFATEEKKKTGGATLEQYTRLASFYF